jgi:DNA-binding transcriptional MerR regulator
MDKPHAVPKAASPGATASQEVSLADLCVLAGMSVRTVRYYMQLGLVDRPEGETRAALYGARHLEQLLQIRKWSEAGLSLERIRELLHGAPPSVPARMPQPGSLEVRSHLMVADGVEVSIEPGRAGLTPEQVRQLVKGIMAVYAQVRAEGSGGAGSGERKGGGQPE